MPRCDEDPAPPTGRRRLLLMPLFMGLLAMPDARAQSLVRRAFPAEALRATLLITTPPEVRLNGEAARLSPGARLRDESNLLVMSASLIGRRLPVHYTTEPQFDGSMLLREVWILRPDELERFWPRTREEAALHQFDPVAQTWTRRGT
ncbi:MAG: hypothetical protein RLZZ592_1153 [Pseudomonadota bacterium]|nr:hypothetical protein [Pseudomonadota bacterium]